MPEAPIVFGSDHAGLPLKSALLEILQQQGIATEDQGTHTFDSCDYPVLASEVCQRIQQTRGLGVLVCGSGLGMSMVANRYQGIRAALCTNEYLARMARLHNNANILCLGDRVLGIDLAQSILETFLNTPFEGGRHQRRVDLIDTLPQRGQ
ncbi:ribose 5-phosphate isomerase B [Desulfohalobium retbaense]|uniref:Ribose 5-phosphate isomerase B n=1 Tax=Desulfohalobium retbaense (strain ATCC 49708 / DSM 5692 / JCM 16813 / HR100) TaxID=485915 RepID=C8X146_DESRD|nr:ribose 5-phosphate isomerase B [Desulfohalobium retbaense]ACV68143.1 ribose 5-phosphate isomerase B [Desulfohalobium retbaense DSM 5692]